MSIPGRISAVCAALALSFAAYASFPEKPQPERLVNDLAGVLPAHQVDSLEQALVAFDDSTSNQICVITVPDLEGYDVSEYALRIANNWGVGSNLNNGVVILLKPRGSDGYVDVSIQVGRGLEGAIPDVYASRIIRNVMGPYLRRDEYMPAIANACEQLQKLASGEISVAREDEEDVVPAILTLIFIVLFIVILIILSRKSDNRGGPGVGGGRNIYPGPYINWGGGNFGGSGRGNFGGGFGGFGGGSFGGGGASGRF